MSASVEKLLIQNTTSIARLTVADSFVVVREIAHTNVCCKSNYSILTLWYMCLNLIHFDHSPCHPGPCPPCSAMSPMTSCFCGSETYQTRCVDTDYSSLGRSCGRICGELLGCGKHSCKSECHAGLCPPCDVEEVQSCYCGKHERKAKCGSGSPVESNGKVGYYSCKGTCNQYVF